MLSYVNTDEISSNKLNYWLKSHLALYITRQAIKPSVKTVIKQFADDALDHIRNTKGVPIETLCRTCDIQNLLHCPTKGICVIKDNQCNFHNEPNKQYRKCPKGICDALLEKIKKAHRFVPPWKNTNSKEWGGEDLIEMAKCYMPKEGYQNIKCFDRVDFNGVINVIINHKGFQKEMTDDLSTDQNICCKARSIGNKIRHSSLAIEEADFNEYIEVFMELLSDDKFFRDNADAKRARANLMHLKSSGPIEQKTEEFSKVCQEVENDTNSETKQKNVAIVKMIEERRNKFNKEERKNLINTFRSDLIRYYRNRHSTLQVSPLHASSDGSLNDLYVQPEMYLTGPFGKITIDNYHELLYEKIGHRQKDRELREIYITSASGKGKTTYGKRMSIVWCQAHEPLEIDEKHYTKEDLETLKTFDFIFFIPLKDIKGQGKYIDDMILGTIVPDLANEHIFKTANFIPELLSKHRCIIFLDGLDEYTIKKGRSTQKRKVSRIPKRKVRDNCTYITTSRPWKLESVQLSTTQIDRKVEIGGLSTQSADKLIDSVTRMLNSKYRSKMNSNDCKKEFERRSLEVFKSIPIILLQMICLWFAKKPLGRSQCEVYSNVLELLFERAKQKDIIFDYKDDMNRKKLPSCFDNNSNCKKNRALLILLGKLSFEALYGGFLDSPYVFDKCTIQRCQISEEQIQYCLNVGLLTQVKGTDPIFEQEEMFSFLHQTFQEFLAGLYISTTNSNEINRMLSDIFHSVADIVDISTIFVFMCGLCPMNISSLSNLLVSIQGNDPSVKKYLGGIDHDDENFGLKRLQTTILDCFQECQENSREDLKLDLECVFITSKIKEKTHHLKNLKHILGKKNTFKAIEISQVDDTITDNFHLTQSNITFGKISVQECNLAELDYCLITNSFKKLTCLQLRSVSFDDRKLSAIVKCQNLRNISFWNIKLGHVSYEIFANFLSTKTEMKEIELKSIECHQRDQHSTKCGGHTVDLASHKDLETVDIFDTSIAFQGLCNKNLKRFALRYIPGEKALANALPMLGNARVLQYLVCTNFSQVAELNHILPSFTKLKYLEVEFGSKMILSNETSIKISENMIALEILKLRRLRLTKESFEKYFEEILQLKQAITVYMEEVSFGNTDDFNNVKNKIESNSYSDLDHTITKENMLVFSIHGRIALLENSQQILYQRARSEDKNAAPNNVAEKAEKKRVNFENFLALLIVILGILGTFVYSFYYS